MSLKEYNTTQAIMDLRQFQGETLAEVRIMNEMLKTHIEKCDRSTTDIQGRLEVVEGFQVKQKTYILALGGFVGLLGTMIDRVIDYWSKLR